jgi:hypothetical protein
MTEEEWLKCEDPTPMLVFLKGKVSDRKLRLFAVACCRSVWESLKHRDCRTAVEVAERYADGLVDVATLRQAADKAAADLDFDGDTICWHQPEGAALICAIPKGCDDFPYSAYSDLEDATFDAVDLAAGGSAHKAAILATERYTEDNREVFQSVYNKVDKAERLIQCKLVRDIFGNPFGPVTLDSSWLTSTVVSLAQQMYDSRDFSPMPILADALQDAGCDNAAILDHCRDPKGVHVRGCFVVDMLLDKA